MTLSPPWKQIPHEMPINGVAYWVAQYRWFSVPFIATWDEATASWEPAEHVIPLYPWYVTPWFRMQ
jgi:hypothetical protein